MQSASVSPLNSISEYTPEEEDEVTDQLQHKHKLKPHQPRPDYRHISNDATYVEWGLGLFFGCKKIREAKHFILD